MTPLHLAVAFRKKDIVKLLLESGSDKNKVNNYGKTPLEIAHQRNYGEIISLFE
jgi:ankyrin repeat protein